jgi:hypothetical protein
MSAEEFRRLVKEISDRSTQAAFSIGTREFCEGADSIPQFPAEKYFNRHLSWLWWNQGTIEQRSQNAQGKITSQPSETPGRKFERKLELDGDSPTVISRNPIAAVKGVRMNELHNVMPSKGAGPVPTTPLSKEELHEWKKADLIVTKKRATLTIILGGVSLVFFGYFLIGLFSGKISGPAFRLISIIGGSLSVMIYRSRRYW